MAVYAAFKELLLALPEKGDAELKNLFRKAIVAHFEVPFLFEDNKRLRGYLEQLCKRVDDEVIKNIFFCEGMRQAGITNDPGICARLCETSDPA